MAKAFSHDSNHQNNILAQFDAIAASASGRVDWSREPLTKREATKRRLWIADHMETTIGRALISTECQIYELQSRAPLSDPKRVMPGVGSDLIAAAKEADVLNELEQIAKDEAEWAAYDDEIDAA